MTAARTGGQLRLPADDGRISAVSRNDVARCLAALATEQPAGRHHDITGPQALNLTAIADAASQTWKTPIAYQPITHAAYQTELAAADETAWWSYAYASMFEAIRQQRWNSVSSVVTRITGRPPTSLSAILARSLTTTPPDLDPTSS